MGWQFPVRVFQPIEGTVRLLNWGEAEPRLRAFLGEQYPAICGRWFFTWTAQKIDCTAESVVQSVTPYVQPIGVMLGSPYTDPSASGSTTLHWGEGRALTARLNIDPGIVARQRAENDVAIGEMTGRSVSLDDALRNRSSERVSGTVTVTFELDEQGRVIRRRRVTVTEITAHDGTVERDQTTQTTEWTPLHR